MPRVKASHVGSANRDRAHVSQHGQNHVPNGPCVGSNHCAGEPIDGAPIRICGRHLRELYAFAADLVESNWDGAVREYVSGLHDTFKPPRAVKQPLAGWLYFVRFGDRVKIGYTTNPDQRLRDIPHERVIGIVPGTRADEKAWHALLANFHVVGEWFAADPEVVRKLEQVVRRPA